MDDAVALSCSEKMVLGQVLGQWVIYMSRKKQKAR